MGKDVPSKKKNITNRDLYRDWVKSDDLVRTIVSYKETDLCIMGTRGLEKEATEAVLKYRTEIDPREIMQEPIKAVEKLVEEKIEMFGSRGKG